MYTNCTMSEKKMSAVCAVAAPDLLTQLSKFQVKPPKIIGHVKLNVFVFIYTRIYDFACMNCTLHRPNGGVV